MNNVKEVKMRHESAEKSIWPAADDARGIEPDRHLRPSLPKRKLPPRLVACRRRLPNRPCWPAARASIWSVPLYQSRVVTVVTPANRVSVANPQVADIVVISPTELYVLGKDLGTTNVLLWDNGNRLIGAINVEVQQDLDSLKRKFAELLPGQPIEVQSLAAIDRVVGPRERR